MTEPREPQPFKCGPDKIRELLKSQPRPMYVFPVRDSKRPVFEESWRRYATCDPDEAAELFRRASLITGQPQHLVAIECGKSGIIVVDADLVGWESDVEWRRALDEPGSLVRASLTRGTPHWYFSQEPLTNRWWTMGDDARERYLSERGLIGTGKWPYGDIKGVGGYVVLSSRPVIRQAAIVAPSAELLALLRSCSALGGSYTHTVMLSDLDAWLDSLDGHPISVGDVDKFVEQVIGLLDMKVVDEAMARRQAVLQVVYHAAIEAERGYYSRRQIYDAVLERYACLRDDDPNGRNGSDPLERWGSFREREYRMMWVGMADKIETGDEATVRAIADAGAADESWAVVDDELEEVIEWASRAASGELEAVVTVAEAKVAIEAPALVAVASTGGGGSGPLEPPDHLGELGDEFWRARPALTKIRQAAWSRGLPARPLLHETLCRALAMTSPRVVLPPPPRTGSINLMVVTVGHPGAGKDATAELASALLPDPTTAPGAALPAAMLALRVVQAGSGEGLVKAFFERDLTVKGAKVYEPRKDRRVMVDVREASVLRQLAERSGSTYSTVIRQVRTGGRAGFTNAAEDRTFTLEPHSYRCCVSIGAQFATAAWLFEGADEGTPQRLLWAVVHEERDMPDNGRLPPWPGELGWRAPGELGWPGPALPGGDDLVELVVDRSITASLELARRARLKRALEETDSLDGHTGLNRLTVAAALALLEGSLEVTAEDWRLAEMVVDASDVDREFVAVRAREAATRRQTEREDTLTQARERAADLALERQAARLARAVWRLPEGDVAKRGMMTRAIRPAWRRRFDELTGLARLEGWIVGEGNVWQRGPRRPPGGSSGRPAGGR